jgi:hypothetical protein
MTETRRSYRNISREQYTEKQRVEILLDGFEFEGSKGEQFLEAICPGKLLTFNDLKIIGLICESICGITFERDFGRSRALVAKWLTDHYDQISPLTEIVKIEAEEL